MQEADVAATLTTLASLDTPNVKTHAAWVDQLSSQVGIEPEDIPEAQYLAMIRAESKGQANKLFFEWYNTRTTQTLTLTDDDTKLFKSLVSIENTRDYRATVSNIESVKCEVVNYHRSINSKLEYMMEEVAKLDKLKGQASKDFTAEVKAMTQDGWLKYSSELTKINNDRPSFGDDNSPSLMFVTPRIFCKFYNEKAGVDMTVDMGSYAVKYSPQKGRLQVIQHDDNLEHDGYFHPHVSGGNVCWGNAAEAYAEAMRNYTPSKIIPALRTILTHYNDGSPYTAIHNFAVVRDPNMFKDKEKVYVEWDNTAWIRDSDLPSYFDYSRYERETRNEDDEDYMERRVTVFVQEYEGTQVRVPHTGYFLRLGDNRGRNYVEIDEDIIQNWD